MEYQVREGEGGGSLVVSAGERPMVLARIQ
jgi:hypothetical protein